MPYAVRTTFLRVVLLIDGVSIKPTRTYMCMSIHTCDPPPAFLLHSFHVTSDAGADGRDKHGRMYGRVLPAIYNYG